MSRRLDQFADLLALDRTRIAAWAFAQAILSAWWSLEDHPALEAGQTSSNDGWQRALAVAQWLDPYT